MSGGSWDYAFTTFHGVADRLALDQDPLRVALGAQIKKIALAMQAIECADSGDSSKANEVLPIKEALKLRTHIAKDIAAKLRLAADTLEKE
jgi:hypothetical protein